MKKIYLFTNHHKKAAGIRKWFRARELGQLAGLTASPGRADLFMVAGGDGALLHAISLFRKYNKPFFGINRGTSGFLLNPVDSAEELKEIFKNLSALKLVKLHLLRGSLSDGKKAKTFYAFNDFYAKASRGNARVMGVVSGDKDLPRLTFEGDGIIISTPQGSTAYNYAAGGSIISLDARQMGVKSICSRKPLRAVVPEQKITVEITYGRATAYADHGQIMAGAKKITVRPAGKSVTLAFKPGFDFERNRWQ